MTKLNKQTKGQFITICGTEGSGKGTLIEGLKEAYAAYEDVIFTREPGGCDLSEKIRHLIMTEEMDLKTELLLVVAARREHVLTVINPALAAGKIVICDRYKDSSYAYQGCGRGIEAEPIDWLHAFIEAPEADLTLWLNLSPEEGLARIVANQRDQNRLDQEDLAFHHRVYQGYQDLAAAHPARIRPINGRLPKDERLTQARQWIERLAQLEPHLNEGN